ncbi:MAG: hypothetical protein WCL48_02120 [Betaproteobacteria bacterium]
MPRKLFRSSDDHLAQLSSLSGPDQTLGAPKPMPSRASLLYTPFKSAGFAEIKQDRDTMAYQTEQERIAQAKVNVLSKQGAVQLA